MQTHLESAKSATERLAEAHSMLGSSSVGIPSELCRLEQVARMIRSISHVLKILVEETGIRIGFTAINIASQLAGAVMIRVEQIRGSERPKAEKVILLADLRESYLGPILQLFMEITELAENKSKEGS